MCGYELVTTERLATFGLRIRTPRMTITSDDQGSLVLIDVETTHLLTSEVTTEEVIVRGMTGWAVDTEEVAETAKRYYATL